MVGACGSAPRGRGTGARASSALLHRRFSPAWAGNGSVGPRRDPSASVQPRVGGEREQFSSASSRIAGSAPRGRGTACGRQECTRRGRFSPAWAGNGAAGPEGTLRGPVQPRVGGERRTRGGGGLGTDGSAPRGRGTGSAELGRAGHPRFSPAWAGNGFLAAITPDRWSVQPRVGGERARRESAAPRRTGSAPRGRGTDAPHQRRIGEPRFSPAWAGNGMPASTSSGASPVQPRVGGERFRMSTIAKVERGSAPRGRGTDLLPSCENN